MNIFSSLIGMLPPAVQKYLPWITLVATVGGGGVVYTQEESQCSEESVAYQFVYKSSDAIKAIQSNLKAIGYGDVIPSGVVDDQLSSALLALCGNLESAGGQYVVDSLNESITLLTGFANNNPKWQALVDNVGFKSWLQQQSDVIKQQVADAVTAGTTPPINIIYQYEASIGNAPAVAALPTELNLLFKDTIPPESLELAPLKWKAPEECNCAPEVIATDRFPNYIYGLAPYWNTEEMTIDFSSLTRIAYYGLSLDQHFDLVDVKSWKNSPTYNDFLVMARQYKTRVDLSIYNNQWQAWYFNHEGVKFTDAVEKKRWVDQVKRDQRTLAEVLIYKVDQLVKEPLNDFPLNNLKTIVSFGQSPSRTMADGVTLHFDFNTVPDVKKQQAIFDAMQETRFFSDLKRVLNNNSADGNDYYLNLIVPIDDLINNEGFYAIGNLKEILKYINLLILVDNNKDVSMGKLRLLRHNIEMEGMAVEKVKGEAEKKLQLVQLERELLGKIVPLVKTKDNEQLEELFTYIDWSFSGVAVGPLPFSMPISEQIKQGFIDSNTTSVNPLQAQVDSALQQFCSYVCPNRWYLRVTLFMLVLVAVAMVVMPCSIKERLTPNMISSALIMYVAVFVATFWCDPYWKEQQDIMLVIITAALFLSYYYRKVKKRRESEYP